MGTKRRTSDPDESGETITKERVSVKKPRPYAVIMHNDDYTTQEFVVHVLMSHFNKSAGDADRIMMAIHVEGKAKVGIFSKDIAESKTRAVISYARENGMPLLVTIEPA